MKTKSAFFFRQNKGADQLHGNRAAEQRLCNRYIDSTTPVYLLNPEFHTPSHLLWLYSPVCVAGNWSKIPMTRFLKTHDAAQ